MLHISIWDECRLQAAAFVGAGITPSVHVKFSVVPNSFGPFGYAAISTDAADALAAELRRAAEDARARDAAVNPKPAP